MGAGIVSPEAGAARIIAPSLLAAKASGSLQCFEIASMNIERQIGKVVLTFVLVIVFGVVGLMTIEGWSFLDALYMTITTISTVGYREIRPLSTTGTVFIIVFIIAGVGAFLFIVTTLAEYVVSGHLKGALEKKRMKKMIGKHRGHYLVCGFGRVGQQVALDLKREGMDFVIIDVNPSALGKCARLGYLYVEGSASNDAVLKEAGIMEAAGLVSAIDSDAENVYVTLSAKSLRKDLYVVARASSEEAEYKLMKAGADRVISPYSLGGRRLAGMLLRPNVVDFLELVMHSGDMDLFIEEIVVGEGFPLEGATIGQAKEKKEMGVNILAVKSKRENKIIANPHDSVRIERGDLLIILGPKERLKALET
jgi:voltage-gated potassium channel